MAIAPRMALAASPAKATLRALLSQNATRLGLTASAIDVIVARSQITHWRAAQGPARARARGPRPRLRAAGPGGRAHRSAAHAGRPRGAGGRLARQGEPLRGGFATGR